MKLSIDKQTENLIFYFNKWGGEEIINAFYSEDAQILEFMEHLT